MCVRGFVVQKENSERFSTTPGTGNSFASTDRAGNQCKLIRKDIDASMC